MNLKIIDEYQWKVPSLMAKYEMGTYQKVYFGGRIHIQLNLITCKDKVVILPIIQSYVLHW